MIPRLAPLLLLTGLALPAPAEAQRFEGAVAGTLDCPARSLFESGSTQVRGAIRNGVLSVGLGPVTVTGRIIDIGPQPAVRLERSSFGNNASFDGLVIGGSQLHARGILNERPCNLNLTLSVPPIPPGGLMPAQPARAMPNLDGPWQGSVSCPLQGLGAPDRIDARGGVSDNVLDVEFASIRAQGRIASLSPRPALRIEGGNSRGVRAGFDATVVTPQRIEGRGMVGGQPCTIALTPVRLTPEARPSPPPAPPLASLGKPPPTNEPAPQLAPPPPPLPQSSVEKPPPSNASPPIHEPEPVRPPPVASNTPAPTPAPAPRTPGPSPAAADQLACALAGTCPTPAPR